MKIVLRPVGILVLTTQKRVTWLRKALRRKVISSDEEAAKYKEIVEELGPKLNAFIKTTKQ